MRCKLEVAAVDDPSDDPLFCLFAEESTSSQGAASMSVPSPSLEDLCRRPTMATGGPPVLVRALRRSSPAWVATSREPGSCAGGARFVRSAS